MDWLDVNFEKWVFCYYVLVYFRIKEVFVFVLKVSWFLVVVVELCWLDDFDYIIGYVVGKKMGYQCIIVLKEYGFEDGCCIFFIDGFEDVNMYIYDLEKQFILIEWEEDYDL